MNKIYIPGMGNPDAKLIILGEKVGYFEEQKKQPFAGQSGKLLRDFCTDSGIDISECYLTNVLKYNTRSTKPKDLKDEGIDLQNCINQVQDEVRQIGANAVLALGNLAMQAMVGIKTGITKWRGSVLRSNFQIRDKQGNLRHVKVIPSFNPAAFLWSKDKPKGQGVQWSAKAYVTLDFKRAREQSTFADYRPPARNLEVCRSYPQFRAFVEKYKNRKKYPYCAIDIETIKCIPILIAFAFTKDHAISVPLMNLDPINFTPNELVEIWLLIDEILNDPEIKIIGQNFKFDQEKLERPCGFRIPKLYADTSLMMRYVYPELKTNLGFLGSIFTEEPFYKDDGKEFNIKKDDIQKYMIYNAKDVAIDLEVFFALDELIQKYGLKQFFDLMMPAHAFVMRMERNGIKQNEVRKAQLISKYTMWADEVHSELNLLTQLNCECDGSGTGCTYNSNKKMRWLLFEKFDLPERAKIDEDSLCAMLSNARLDYHHRTTIEDLYKLRRIRKAKKSAEAKPDYDGRMRTSVNINGTETGRRSNRVLKPPVRPTQVGQVFQILTKHGEFGPDIRESYEADEGCEFGQVDSSQAEARIVALLAEDYDLLKLFDTIDVHCLTTSWIFEKTLEQAMKDKADGKEDERFVGKTARHAGNYDMGKHRFALDVTSGARRFNIRDSRTNANFVLSEARADQILRTFHSKSPKIRGIFHESVRKALKDNKRVLVNPFGRRRLFMDRWGEPLFREGYAQIPQSTVGDNTILALMRAEKRFAEMKVWVQFLSESHDAGLVQYKIEDRWKVLPVLKEEFERPIDFGPCTLSRGSLVIPADLEVGTNYRHLKKIKKNDWPKELIAS